MEFDKELLTKKFGVYHRNTDYSNRGSLASKYKKILEQTSKRMVLQVDIPQSLVKKRKIKSISNDDIDSLESKMIKLDSSRNSDVNQVTTKIEKNIDSSFPTQVVDIALSSSLTDSSTFSVINEEKQVTEANDSFLQTAKNNSLEDMGKNYANSTSNSILNLAEVESLKREADKSASSENQRSRLFRSLEKESGLQDQSSTTVFNDDSLLMGSETIHSRQTLQETTKAALLFLNSLRIQSKPKSKPFLAQCNNHSVTARVNNKRAFGHCTMNIPQRLCHSSVDSLHALNNISENIAQWKHQMMQTV